MRHRLRALAFFSRWDKPLIWLAVVCVAALLLSQALLLRESSRRYLSRVDKIEGESVALQLPGVGEPRGAVAGNTPVAITLNPQRRQKTIIIKALKPTYPVEAWVTVNGGPAADFRRGDVELAVFEGDYLEIDASRLAEPGVFCVSIPEGGIESPADGQVLTGPAALLPVGKVKFKP